MLYVQLQSKKKERFKACYWLCQREFIQIAVCIEGVNFSQVEEFLQGFVDEDEANERCKSLLCEASDVAD